MRIALFGHRGKVGSVLAPALEAAGHEVRGIGPGEEADVAGLDAALDFTRPDAAGANARAALEQGVPVVVGTSGLSGAELDELDALARERSLQLLVVPNFAIGAVLMMRFAEAAAEFLPRAEIVELHNEAKKDAPSGTARATAERLAGLTPRPRGPKATAVDPRDKKITELERETRRLQVRPERAEGLIEVQKKVAQLLGVPLASDQKP